MSLSSNVLSVRLNSSTFQLCSSTLRRLFTNVSVPVKGHVEVLSNLSKTGFLMNVYFVNSPSKSLSSVLSVDQLIAQIKKLKLKLNSNGTVAVAGLEPFKRPEFLSSLLPEVHKHGLKTCVVTTGNVSKDYFERILAFTDEIILCPDILSENTFSRKTGDSNLIQFLVEVHKKNIPVTLRIPLMNSVAHVQAEIKIISEMCRVFKNIIKVELESDGSKFSKTELSSFLTHFSSCPVPVFINNIQ
jgi:hypothetical protein